MIIDRYLTREVIRPFLVTSVVLVGIFTTFSLAQFLVDANSGLLKMTEVVNLTALKALISMEVLMPLSFYLAVMIGLGRLHSDAEIYAMRAGGISERRSMRPIMILACALALLVGAFSILVRPWAYVQSYHIKAVAEASMEVDRIKPSQFYTFDNEGRTVYIEQVSDDGRDLRGVFIRTRDGDDLQVISSATGTFDYLAKPLLHRITLKDARVFKSVHDGPDLFGRFGKFTLWLPAQTGQKAKPSPESTSTSILTRSSLPDDTAEYQWRLSTPVSTLLLALLAIPLSRSRPRQGRFARILLALLVYALYFSLLDISRSWVQRSAADTIWWVPGLLCMGVFALYTPWIRLRKERGARSAQD